MDRRIVGSCGKPHGLHGEVAVYTDIPEAIRPGITLETPDAELLTVVASRPHKSHLLVSFEEITDRTAAEALRNLELSIDAGDRPPLAEDEYWASDLVGREARDVSGNRLGEVTNVIGSPVQDRLVVATANGAVEVPFVPDIVTDVADDHVVVDAPEGLFPRETPTPTDQDPQD